MEKMVSYPRTRGRYSSSELYGILHGYITAETWINPKPKEPKDCLKMWNGTVTHKFIQDLLPQDLNEVKTTISYKGITLVAKADHLPSHVDEVWEFKTNDEELDVAKDGHKFQTKLYCSMFKRAEGKIYQPVQTSDGLYLKDVGTVKRDDSWAMEQMEKLYQFHLSVERLYEQKN